MNLSPWLQEFAEAVAAEMILLNHDCPIGCHICEVDGSWEVSLFASRTEIVGGSRDGKFQQPVYTLDVLRILPLFDAVDAVQWQNQPVNRRDELGAHLEINGRIEEHPVSLRILAKAPSRFGAGQQMRVHENAVVQTW